MDYRTKKLRKQAMQTLFIREYCNDRGKQGLHCNECPYNATHECYGSATADDYAKLLYKYGVKPELINKHYPEYKTPSETTQQYRKRQHLCTWCGKPLPKDRPQQRCFECSTKTSEYNRQYYENAKEYKHRYYLMRKEESNND